MPAVKKLSFSLRVALLACFSLLAWAAVASCSGFVRVYVGTYTAGESRGIYRLRLDLTTGALATDGEPTEAVNPSFLAFSPDGSRLFVVNETGDSQSAAPGQVSAFAVDAATGALTFLNQQSSGGPAPCHVSVDSQGRHVLVANYWGGSVSVFPVDADGRLGPATAFVQHEEANAIPGKDALPHAHSIDLDAANRYAIVADLGLDRLFAYRFDATRGTLTAPAGISLPLGAGPRHFTFHPDARHGYVINEGNSTLTAFAYEPEAGALRELQTLSTLPAGFSGRNSTAEIAVSPDGRFLYGSNRGHDSLAIFAIDAGTGKLTPIGHEPTRGQHPRHFALDPTGAYLLAANRDSDSVTVFRIARTTGKLEPIGAPFRIPRPVCLRITGPLARE